MGKGKMMRMKIHILMKMAMMGGCWREGDNEERIRKSVMEDQRKARVMMNNDHDKKDIVIDLSK